MKKPILLIGVLFLLFINMTAQNNVSKYEKDWKRVAFFKDNDMPDLAAIDIDRILKKAIADKNISQIIKAYFHKDIKDFDDNVAIFADLQNLLPTETDEGRKALLNSILAELYINYYSGFKWYINQRTAMANTSDDIKEWPANTFMEKVANCLDASLNNPAELHALTTHQYDDIIIFGEDSEEYYPTLYDFLMKRTIAISKRLYSENGSGLNVNNTQFTIKNLAVPADRFIGLDIPKNINTLALYYYKQYFADLLVRNLTQTIVLTELDKVSYMDKLSYTFRQNEELKFLTTLNDKYKGNENVVMITAKVAEALTEKDEKSDEDKNRNLEKAYNLCKDAISKYPDFKKIDLLKEIVSDLEMPDMQIKASALYFPHDSAYITLKYKNLQALTEMPELQLNQIREKDTILVKSFVAGYKSAKTYITEEKEIDLGKLAPGEYMLVLKRNLNPDEPTADDGINFSVSQLATYSRNSGYQECEVFVVDRRSGKPAEGVVVTLFKEIEDELGLPSDSILSTAKTDKLGLASFSKIKELNAKEYNQISYKVSLGDDKWLQKQNVSLNYSFNNNFITDKKDDRTAISVFTDRDIYRPGQTVYFKAIAVNDKSVLVNKTVTAEMIGSNSEVISELKLNTNEFGSVSGNFVAPLSGLLGQYCLRVGCEEALVNSYFLVEEYKRPTFDITFDKVDKTYTFGQEVTLKGYARTFSGVNLQDANVEYMINGSPLRVWGWSDDSDNFFERGNVKTMPDGSFEIRFTPQAGDIAPGIFHKNIYTFNINASVTDVNGETQSSNYSLVVGNVSMIIGIDIPQQIEKSDTSKVFISALNLDMQDIETSGDYEIYNLDKNDSIQNSVAKGSFSKTGEQSALLAQIKKLQSGKYRIKVKALDNKSIEIDADRDFILFSYEDKKPPYETNEWLVQKNTRFAANKDAEILFGVSAKDMYVLYQLYDEDKVFARELMKQSDANKLLVIPYKPEYGDRIYLNLTYVKDSHFYNKLIELTKEQDEAKSDDNMVLKLETFRDKLRPGDKETWTLSVKDKENNPLSAEILASMYDISFDKIYSSYYRWKLTKPFSNLGYRYVSGYDYMDTDSYVHSIWLDYDLPYENITSLSFDRIDWYGFAPSMYSDYLDESEVDIDLSEVQVLNVDGFDGRKKIIMQESASAPPMVLAKSAVGVSISGTDGNREMADAEGEPFYYVPAGIQDVQLRRNFNETAFFYPQLRTNDKGETNIEFTVPESNTIWQFRAFAHNKDLQSNLLEEIAVTRKELMVIPNLPRFLRQGDEASISTMISNLSDGAISGNVHIEFFNPANEEVINLNIANQQQAFNVAKDGSVAVNWTFMVPTNIDMIGCRIVAGNDKFSDGEQHVLAILPGRMLVTESMPIDVNKEGETVFKFDKLADDKSTTREDYRLTFEFASNPAWYAIMAMPTLNTPSGESVLDWFASYYVNRLGKSIVQRYPQIKTIIERWKKQGDSSALTSALLQNEELKNVLLSETPWVLDAKNETEQIQRLSTLFDTNNIDNKIQIATAKLQELQDPMGGWRWYDGMYPSRSLTQYLLFAFADLQTYGQVEYNDDIKLMQMEALKFIDNELRKEYEQLKKDNKDLSKVTSIDTGVLEYLFIRSSYRDIPINQETREAERFYTAVASKNWKNLTLYERSILSIVLNRNGDKKVAQQLVKSIAERAVVNDKQGMYWPNNKNRSFMTMSAICNHAFLMKALIENGASEKEIDLMKQWLIRQKQTQAWESTNATIDAINILLGTGSNTLDTDKSNTLIKVGNKIVGTDKSELGTGYVKATWSKSEITGDMATVSITRADSKPAYGAIYLQYYENLDKISGQKSAELDVKKQLYKEVTTDAGKQLTEITETSPLKVGDRVVVRLVVNVAQDVDFVQLKDMRAPCFEPVNTVSGTEWRNGAAYYHETRDASTNFYFDTLLKGTYVFEYSVVVNRSGEYSNGITTIQSLYAPEYISHTQGIKVKVMK